MGQGIPQEIWWLVCQVLQKRQDARSLFRAALVCSSWANHALPLLYSIHDSAGTDDVGTTFQGKYMWVGMWRSIILSSIGVTQYPYCLWLKSLGLSDLEQLLRDVATNPSLRPRFFEGPMREFEILSGSSRTRAGKPILEWQKIIEKVGDTVTKFAKEAADEENKIVQLTNLEGANLPTSLLSVWTSRLATLTTLSIQDGSVLTQEVAVSIRDHCPAFRDLTCFHIQGQTVDENMSAFFRTLKPNSLQNFAVLSSNQIGHDTLDGLMQHSESLRILALKSLQNTALPFLDLLSNCQYLESLSIESSTPSPPSTWAAEGKDPLVVISAWLQECKYLRKLEIKNLCGASKLLAEVLKSPTLRLRDLEIKLIDDEEAFYTALGNQTELESFMFRSTVEVIDQNGVRHDAFMGSICSCKNLNDLNIMQNDHMQLTPEDLTLIQDSLTELESLSFDGEWLNDEIWAPLLGMPSLTTININGLSLFTYEGIEGFLKAVASMGGKNSFRLYIMNQYTDAKIKPFQLETLNILANKIPGGSLDFSYWRDPSEDEMSDLSD